MPITDDQVALARHGVLAFGFFNLDVGLRAGHTLEVLQRLLNVAQIQDVARLDGHSSDCATARIAAFRKPNGAHATRQHREGKGSGFEVLWLGEDAGRDEAARDHRVLHSLDHGGDAVCTQATPDGRVTAVGTCRSINGP